MHEVIFDILFGCHGHDPDFFDHAAIDLAGICLAVPDAIFVTVEHVVSGICFFELRTYSH